ncbi:DUF488 domain-containing protein [Chromobacterium sp. IIBBL 290-4]|uniref:DUF488 domain-containing protein n=1 Tax=Chromobacterium sp. IIBBL 290-4 TaxID=2953890 RepID=UPI0020B6649D|nr:DUF488 family protein [Chromobacterium sp. IIBBL 290-4]UTH74034.1 DUF488 family protein [Chromobacterium sp. IIBBL 290-4]
MNPSIRLVSVADCKAPPASGFLLAAKWPRQWPRSALQAGHWLPRVMPTEELVAWMHGDAQRWPVFCEIYWSDLAANPARWQPLLAAMRQGELVLLHACASGERTAIKALEAFLRHQAAAVKAA